MKRPNATLDIEGTPARMARFRCDQELDLEGFMSAVAEISRFGGYVTLTLYPSSPGASLQPHDCVLKTGVAVDWETWVDIGNLLCKLLGIKITM